ncbi:MAG: hypothetical protein ABDH66_00500 [Bacteroidia bacterium]
MLILLMVGLLNQHAGLSVEALRILFWISYLFSIFQAVPRSILDRRPEEWRWLHQIFSSEGNATGIWLYAISLAVGIGVYFTIGGRLLWGYRISLWSCLLGGVVMSVPIAFSAFIAVRAEASYALASVLAFPLVIFPLVWVGTQGDYAPFPMVVLFVAESLLFLILLPAVWRD